MADVGLGHIVDEHLENPHDNHQYRKVTYLSPDGQRKTQKKTCVYGNNCMEDILSVENISQPEFFDQFIDSIHKIETEGDLDSGLYPYKRHDNLYANGYS